MRFTQFRNEALGYESFDGYTKDELWNGWDCPYFTYEQAQKILDVYNRLRAIIGETRPGYYDREQDAFVFPVEDDSEVYYSQIEQDQKYYSIGAYSWIWEERSSNNSLTD